MQKKRPPPVPRITESQTKWKMSTGHPNITSLGSRTQSYYTLVQQVRRSQVQVCMRDRWLQGIPGGRVGPCCFHQRRCPWPSLFGLPAGVDGETFTYFWWFRNLNVHLKVGMKQCLGKPLSHCSARDTAQSPAKSSRCWSWFEGLKSKNDMPNTMLTSIATTLIAEV